MMSKEASLSQDLAVLQDLAAQVLAVGLLMHDIEIKPLN